MKSKISKILTTLALAITLSLGAAAQPPPPGDHGGEEDASPQETPIGSGLIILLALGAAYGAKKVYDARKRFAE